MAGNRGAWPAPRCRQQGLRGLALSTLLTRRWPRARVSEAPSTKSSSATSAALPPRTRPGPRRPTRGGGAVHGPLSARLSPSAGPACRRIDCTPGQVHHSQDAMPGGLWARRHDRELLADQRIQQRRLADIGPADQRRETGAKGGCSSAGPLRRRTSRPPGPPPVRRAATWAGTNRLRPSVRPRRGPGKLGVRLPGDALHRIGREGGEWPVGIPAGGSLHPSGSRLGRGGDPRLQQPPDEQPRGLQAAVEVQGAEQRLEGIREDRWRRNRRS